MEIRIVGSVAINDRWRIRIIQYWDVDDWKYTHVNNFKIKRWGMFGGKEEWEVDRIWDRQYGRILETKVENVIKKVEQIKTNYLKGLEIPEVE